MDLNLEERALFLDDIWKQLEGFYDNTDELRVSPVLSKEAVREWISRIEETRKTDIGKAVSLVIEGLKKYAVHTPHSSYFGLFNPRSSFGGIMADLITATMNPQMAAWSHAPFAIEVEGFMIRELGQRFGFKEEEADGVFCTGGAEANLTAVLCAMHDKISKFSETGVIGLTRRPIIYCSAHAHHSVSRAARIVGLGSASVRVIPTDIGQRMKLDELLKQVNEDRDQGVDPIMAVATAGTTGPGSIDPLGGIGALCEQQGMWFHVDAAYGGAIALNDKHRKYLAGCEMADSITFDLHKWMSVPMSTSVFLTSRPSVLGATFGMQAEYMPTDSRGMEVKDPYLNSIQWSRRFIGLKWYMSLIFYGWGGMATLVDRQIVLGQDFKNKILGEDWIILNESPLPVICFTDKRHVGIKGYCQKICDYLIRSGKTWLSVYPIDGCDVLRVCINNYNTGTKEIDELIALLREARNEVNNRNR